MAETPAFDANDFSRFKDIGKDEEETEAQPATDSDDELSMVEQVRRAEACKAEGNDLFRAGSNAEAQAKYEQGLGFVKATEDKSFAAGMDYSQLGGSLLAVKNVTLSLHLNMAATLNKQKAWHAAVRHATRALALDPTSSKALFRRGVARTRSGDLDAGRCDLEAAQAADPGNLGVERELQHNASRIQRAKKKERTSFKGLFAESLYNDKEEERQQKLLAAAEKEAELRATYETEKGAFEAKLVAAASRTSADPVPVTSALDVVDLAAEQPASPASEASQAPAPAADHVADPGVGEEDKEVEEAEEAAQPASDGAPDDAATTPLADQETAMDVEAEAEAEEPTQSKDAEEAARMDVDEQPVPEEEEGSAEAEPAVEPAAAPETFPDFEAWKEARKKKEEAEVKAKKDAEDARRREEQAKRDEEKRRRREERERTKARSKASAASSAAKKSGDGEAANGQASELRGYRRTEDGKVTTYFNRELDEEAKQLLGDITPQRIDAAASGPTPLDATHAAASSGAGSAWNAGGTWEERDFTEWAKEALKRHLKRVVAHKRDALSESNPDALMQALQSFKPGGDGGAGGADLTRMLSLMQSVRMRVTKVKKVEGDASITVVRGTPRYIYEMNVEAEFEAIVTEEKPEMALGAPRPDDSGAKTKTYKGSLDLTDLNSIDPEDCGYRTSWKASRGPTAEHATSVEEALRDFRREVFGAVEAFVAEFRQK